MSTAPLALFAAVLPLLRRQIAAGRDFDLIDAHYFYPDGVAAVLLGRALGRPVVVTARGSDLNVIARYGCRGAGSAGRRRRRPGSSRCRAG